MLQVFRYIFKENLQGEGINNFLDSDAKVEDVMFDATDIVNNIKALDTDNKNNYQSSPTQEREQTKKQANFGLVFLVH